MLKTKRLPSVYLRKNSYCALLATSCKLSPEIHPIFHMTISDHKCLKLTGTVTYLALSNPDIFSHPPHFKFSSRLFS